MKYLISLAFKNIVRYKKRTILTFLILSFGIGFYIWMASFIKGANEQSFDNVINFDTGHFKIQSKEYDEDTPLAENNFIENYQKIEQVLKNKNYVTAYTPRLKFSAELDDTVNSAPCFVVGIQPKTDKDVFTLEKHIVNGKLEKGGILIGIRLAEDMGLKTGDYVYLTFREKQGMFNSIETRISGIINSPDPATNASGIFMHLEEAQKYLNFEGVTEIAAITIDRDQYKKFGKDLKQDLPQFKVMSWIDMSIDFIEISKTKTKFSSIFIVFIIIIAMVGIINTMLISVLQKKREIGTMKALGLTDREVQNMFIFEGGIIGFFGAIFGIILGVLINWYFVEYGIDMSGFIEDMGSTDIGYRISGIAKSTWDMTSIYLAFFASIVTSMIASYFPARKATKMQPVECLRTIQ